MDFNIDFSNVDFLDFKKLNITFEEINSVFANPTAYHEPQEDFIYALGYGSRRKFVQIAYQILKNSNFDMEVLQIDLPYEKDVREHWCKNN